MDDLDNDINNELQENVNNSSTNIKLYNSPTTVDESHIYKLSKKFVRIEFPGLVKNVSKALELLGGTYNIDLAIADTKRRLELKLHPENRLNKPCFSDRDYNPGLVIKIDGKFDYKILGYSYQNFKFNKAIDFQYLPLVNDEYVYDNIFPKIMPNLDFLISKENSTQPILILPSSFSRYDISHHTLYLNASEKFSLMKDDRPELFKIFNHKKPKSKYPYRQISYFLNINDPTAKIPTKPNPLATKLVKDRFLDEPYKKIKKLFDERPMWSRAAIQHKTGITVEMTKVLLPANGYFWFNGPWRMIWTKFGVDPRLDFNLRIYQTLDYRIRDREGTSIKVKAKRKYVQDNFPQLTSSIKLDESHYVLSPELIPPARQMFYQYCDIKIPEIEDMLQRLPKTPGTQKFDSRTGWLPTNFAEQCREIANRYVMERVHQELMKDSLQSQSKSSEKDTDEEDDNNPLSYSSSMLDKMQKGFRRSIDLEEKTVILTDESDDEIIESRNSDTEQISDDSEMELDMETVEEINEIISKI